MTAITFTVEAKSGLSVRAVTVTRLIVAGWTGRDRAKMEEHVAELEAIGVKRPSAMPTFYRVSASRLTIAVRIEVPGVASSGEAEILLVNDGGAVFVGLASDHTEREVEAYGITVSKQMCDKPCAPTLWPFGEVKEHWDELKLASRIEEGAGMSDYQDGAVSAMLAPADLIAALEATGETFGPGDAMLCGTLPAMGGVRPASVFEMTLDDPVLGRRIRHCYDIVSLPVEG